MFSENRGYAHSKLHRNSGLLYEDFLLLLKKYLLNIQVQPIILDTFKSIKYSQGLPWWLSGGESACQCRGHRFGPWSGNIPHAMEQLNPCTTAVKAVF